MFFDLLSYDSIWGEEKYGFYRGFSLCLSFIILCNLAEAGGEWYSTIVVWIYIQKAGTESQLLSGKWIIKIYELYWSTNLFVLFILINCSRILRIKQSLDSMIYQNRDDYLLFNIPSVYNISESCWYGEADWL